MKTFMRFAKCFVLSIIIGSGAFYGISNSFACTACQCGGNSCQAGGCHCP